MGPRWAAGRWMLDVTLFDRLRRTSQTPIAAPMRMSPPTTPPMMGPIGVDLAPDVAWVLVGWGVTVVMPPTVLVMTPPPPVVDPPEDS